MCLRNFVTKLLKVVALKYGNIILIWNKITAICVQYNRPKVILVYLFLL